MSCFGTPSDVNKMMIDKIPNNVEFGSKFNGKSFFWSEWWTVYFYGNDVHSPYGMLNYVVIRFGGMGVALMYATVIVDGVTRISDIGTFQLSEASFAAGKTSISFGENRIDQNNDTYTLKGKVGDFTWNLKAGKSSNYTRPYYIADNINLTTNQKLTFVSQLPGGQCSGIISIKNTMYQIEASKCEIEHLYGPFTLDTLNWTMCHGFDADKEIWFYFLNVLGKGIFLIQDKDQKYRVDNSVYSMTSVPYVGSDYPGRITMYGSSEDLGSFNVGIEVIGPSSSKETFPSENLCMISIQSKPVNVKFTGMLEHGNSNISNLYSRVKEVLGIII